MQETTKSETVNKKCVSCLSVTSLWGNTTNVVRFCIVRFSWQPFLSRLICRFISSAGLRSHSTPTQSSEIIHQSHKKRAIRGYHNIPDFCKHPVSKWTQALWRVIKECHQSSLVQPIVFYCVYNIWAKQKMKIWDRCKLSFPPPLEALLLACAFSHDFFCSP